MRRAGLGGLGGAIPRQRRRPTIIDGQARDADGVGFDPEFGDAGDTGRSSTKIAWGEPEHDWRRPDDRDPPTPNR
jgi:hypothetical protein